MNVRRTPGTLVSSLWSLPVKRDKDQALILKVGNAKVSFDDFYEWYYPRVLAYMRFRIGKPDVVEDLTSLVFERALTHLDDLRTPEAIGAWLFRIARNCAADYFRQFRGHMPEVSLDALDAADHPWGCTPEETALAGEERAALLTQLEQLSEREREVIGLKFVAHLSNREIARVLHMPEGTVSSLLHRALVRLRDALHTEGGTQ